MNWLFWPLSCLLQVMPILSVNTKQSFFLKKSAGKAELKTEQTSRVKNRAAPGMEDFLLLTSWSTTNEMGVGGDTMIALYSTPCLFVFTFEARWWPCLVPFKISNFTRFFVASNLSMLWIIITQFIYKITNYTVYL